jgi:polar amino acid transport system substrate-binding protein
MFCASILASCTSAVGSDEFNRAAEVAPPAVDDPSYKPPACPPGTPPIANAASFAADGDLAKLTALTSKARLVAGVSSDTLLFGFRNPIGGKLEGLDVDIIREVAKALYKENDAGVDKRITFRVIRYKDRLPLLMNGKVDIVAHSMTINCDRWNAINFSSQYFLAGQKIVVRKDSDAESLESLPKGTKVCIPNGGTSEDTIKDLNTKLKLGLEAVGVDDITECLVKLQQGDVDAALSDDTVLQGFVAQDPNLKVVGEQLTQEPYGIGVSKQNVAFAQFINSVLETMRTDGRLQKLYDKYGLKDSKIPPADTSRPIPPVTP